MLDHPSLALELPNGNIIVNDDARHRVLVIDRATKAIVWQYGVTDTPGHAPGLPVLSGRDGHRRVPRLEGAAPKVLRANYHAQALCGRRPAYSDSTLGRLAVRPLEMRVLLTRRLCTPCRH